MSVGAPRSSACWAATARHYSSRDRFSIAELNQFALEYRGQFLEDTLTVDIGAPRSRCSVVS